jgi:hypothetical protein
MKSLALAPAALLASVVAAQTIATFPTTHASIASGSTYVTNIPYSSGVSRVQMEYDAWDITVPNGTPITAIGFRQDIGTASTGHALQLEVRMGTTLSDASNIAGTFDTNYATGPVTVFGPALYTLPGLITTPGNAVIMLPLTTPYVYNSSQNLLVEYRITANNNGNAAWSYYLDAGSFVSPTAQGAQGCVNSGGQRATLTTGSGGAALGGYWYLYLNGAPASSIGFIFLTFRPLVATPYSLASFVPGIDATCQGELDVAHTIIPTTITTNTSGGYYWGIQVPLTPRVGLNNLILTTQAAVFDFFAPGGLVVSNGDQVQLGIQPAETTIISTGSATATSGSVYRNYGVITFFQY